MRVTNKMMTNNSLNNITKNKLAMSKLEEQYSTQKKIQRPSDDPIIAVRALKLRTNLSELNQYYEKNIPDAKSWMDVSESALVKINDILTSVNTYCNQGASDQLTAADRKSIAENLIELKQQIYQEGNANYAGRYVFTGFKTDTSLLFNSVSEDIQYDITEQLKGSDLELISKVTGGYSIDDYDPANPNAGAFADAPNMVDVYRLRLAYDNLDAKDLTNLSYTKEDATGNLVETQITNIISVSSQDPDAYTPADGEVHYIADTGELIMGKDIYEELRLADGIKVDYSKTNFKTGDLRPEHYFDCTTTNLKYPGDQPIVYTKADQQIEYEINFSQKLTINTQASDAIQHAIGRSIDEILSSVNHVQEIENKLGEIDKLLANKSITSQQKEALVRMQEQTKTELVLANKVMQKSFQSCISGSEKHQNTLNVAIADLGSRYVRLELTESRLDSQQVDFTELLSSNEDADLVETVIKFNSQETVYNASLNATSKIVKNTLLDFL